MSVNMADQDIQCDAEGYSTNREYMVGGHAQSPDHRSIMVPSAVTQQDGQRMPYDMGGIAFGVPQSKLSGIPPEYEHFDVALLYAKEDLELALDIQEKLSRFELKDKMYPKICLYDDSCFVASQMCKAENVVKLCTLIFVVLTENLRDDMVVQAVREEAFGLTRLASKDDCDTTKRYCIRPLHTKSEKDRKGVYKTPSGMLTIDSIDWYNYENKAFKYRLKQLLDFHLPYRLKREKHDCGGSSFQTARLHSSVSPDKQNGNMQSMQGQFNMEIQQAMYQSHFREAPGTVQGNLPPTGLENHGQRRAHGNTCLPNIDPTEHTLTRSRANTYSNPVNLTNDAQPESVDQSPRINPVHIETSRLRFESPSHSNAIHHPQEPSSNIQQEYLQTNEHNLSVDFSQIRVDASASVSHGEQEGHGTGNSSFEADVQPSGNPPGAAQTGGLMGPHRDDTDSCINGGNNDTLFGNGRSSDSQNVPKHYYSLSDKSSLGIKHTKSFSEKSSEQSTAASPTSSTILRNNFSQCQTPLNTTNNANHLETFQPLPEDDLVTEPDLDEDGIQTKATKSEEKPSESSSSQRESSSGTKSEDEESTDLKSVGSNQSPNSSTDTTAIKDTDKKDNGSNCVKLGDDADKGPCLNAGEGNDIKSGVGLCDDRELAPLTAQKNPGTSPATGAVTERPCGDLTSGERPSNGSDKVPPCQGHNGMDLLDHVLSTDGPRNHKGTVVSGQEPRKNIGTVASGPGAGRNLVTDVSSPGVGSHLQTADQGQRDTPGKNNNGSSDRSGNLTSGQKPSDDIDTVSSHSGPSNESPRPPIVHRTPGDGESLTDKKVTFSKQSASPATQTSTSDESSTLLVKTHLTTGSDYALSNNLKTPLAKQGNEEVNKVLTHELKTRGPAYISSTKCAAPNVLKATTEVPPTSSVPVIHYHYHAGNQGPGRFDPSVFTPLGEHPQFTPLHVNGAPSYPGQQAAPSAQNPQQHGRGNMSQQAPIHIVNCSNVMIGTDSKMIIGDQRERMTDSDNEDPYDSLTSASSDREDLPPPYSIRNPSSPASTYRKTPLTPSCPPCRGGQEAVTADVSQSRSQSLGNASGLTRDGPRSSFPSERSGNEGNQVEAGFTDLQPGLDSASGLSDITSFTVPELGSASDFLEMVQSELSEDRDSSLAGKGETSVPTD